MNLQLQVPSGGEPVRLCKCLTVNERAIANAEYVIEGEVVPNVRVQEDQNSHTGYAMPEFRDTQDQQVTSAG